MQILIINLTDKPIDICLADTSTAVLTPHKPYILNSVHRPEINFWSNCLDPRFKVVTDQNEVIRYSRAIANRAKFTNDVVNVIGDTTVTEEPIDSVDEEVTENVNIVKETSENIETVDVNKEELEKMNVASLKAVAKKLEVQLPVNAKRKEIIELLLKDRA